MHFWGCRVSCAQADVSASEGELQRDGHSGQIHPADGHRDRGRLQVQVPAAPLDGGREGRPGGAQTHLHPPGQPRHGAAVDVQSGDLHQAEADQQPLRHARIRKCEARTRISTVPAVSRPFPPFCVFADDPELDAQISAQVSRGEGQQPAEAACQHLQDLHLHRDRVHGGDSLSERPGEST